MDALDRRIVNGLQGGFPIADRPYAEAAAELGLSEEELIAHCRAHLAGFKCPSEIRFDELPKTSTGKVQKHVLRDRVGSRAAGGAH